MSKFKDDLKEILSSASQRQCGKIAGGHRIRYPSSNKQQLEHGIGGIGGIGDMVTHGCLFLQVSAPGSCQM